MKNSMTKRMIFLVSAVLIVGVLIGITMSTDGNVSMEDYVPKAYSSVASLLPPVIAIGLALITKEVYTSLFIGIVAGGLIYAGGNLELMLNSIFYKESGGLVQKLSNNGNIGILIFLVVLGILVSLMNKAGGSAAFGKWASTHIKTRIGAQLATVVLGALIFVDDYFNCLTVGSVMRPVTDHHQVSRAKLAYLIDATAAPICIIAPVSSWAAAVTSSVPEDMNINGFTMFLKTIPYNFYALMTLLMMIFITVLKVDFSSMRKHEDNAIKGDLFTTEARPYGDIDKETINEKATVFDLVFPVITLIGCCIVGMIYTGGFFSGESFIDAFANADASKGLVFGSVVTLIVAFVYYISRGVLDFKEFTECIPEGFKSMVAPILILSLAWTLSGMTEILGAKYFVADIVEGWGGAVKVFLPALLFLVAVFLAFATGTSWGTFAILIPIVCSAFPAGEMLVISIAACLSGAVCGDHCSPISDTTIMASAGAHCDHINHVSTQLPYVIVTAVVSFAGYVIAGILGNYFGNWALIAMPVCAVIMLITILVIRHITGKEKI